MSTTDRCAEPKDTGPCFNELLRYHWDGQVSECRPFIYGGCQGNENRFATASECYLTCGETVSPMQQRLYRPTDCYEPTADGGPCDQYELRWYYDAAGGVCLNFYYGGCEGNRNNFHSHDDCIALCTKGKQIFLCIAVGWNFFSEHINNVV